MAHLTLWSLEVTRRLDHWPVARFLDGRPPNAGACRLLSSAPGAEERPTAYLLPLIGGQRDRLVAGVAAEPFEQGPEERPSFPVALVHRIQAAQLMSSHDDWRTLFV